MHPKVARALRAARRPYADGGDVVRERATILPLGTYGDGTTRAAWPGVIYEPAAAAKRLVDYFMGGNYRPGDEDATRQLAEDSFTAASAVPVAGLAAAAIPSKPAQTVIKGYHGTRTAPRFYNGESNAHFPDLYMTGSRAADDKMLANRYANRNAGYNVDSAVLATEARFKNPMEYDAKGKKYDSLMFEGRMVVPEDIADYAKTKGHDGLIIRNVIDPPQASQPALMGDTVVALQPGTVYDDYGNLLFSNSSKASAPGLAALESNRVRGYDIAPLDRNAYISTKDYRNRLASNYFDGDVRKASSREVPVSTELPEVGAWRIDDFKGNYGHDIEHLIRAKLDELEAPELRGGRLDPMKRGDDERYADWLKRGLRPPPVEVLQTEDGAFRIMDGHRRYLAAKRAGMDDVEAWVSYAAPTQKYDANGRPIMTSLTYELARALQNAGVQP